jgi:hypothetical protein
VERIPVNFAGKTATALLLVGLTALAVSETTLDPGPVLRIFGLTCSVAGGIAYWAAAALYVKEVRTRGHVVAPEQPPA